MVNFGADPAKAFAGLREILPQGPLMCGEFYPGWFDTWGQPHHFGNTPQYLGHRHNVPPELLKNIAAIRVICEETIRNTGAEPST